MNEGGAMSGQKKGEVLNVDAPIRVQQHLNPDEESVSFGTFIEAVFLLLYDK